MIEIHRVIHFFQNIQHDDFLNRDGFCFIVLNVPSAKIPAQARIFRRGNITSMTEGTFELICILGGFFIESHGRGIHPGKQDHGEQSGRRNQPNSMVMHCHSFPVTFFGSCWER